MHACSMIRIITSQLDSREPAIVVPTIIKNDEVIYLL